MSYRSGMEAEGRKGRRRISCRLGRDAGIASSDGDSRVTAAECRQSGSRRDPAQDARDQIAEVRGVRVVELGGVAANSRFLPLIEAILGLAFQSQTQAISRSPHPPPTIPPVGAGVA